jgi:hypothetical protein
MERKLKYVLYADWVIKAKKKSIAIFKIKYILYYILLNWELWI